MSDRRTAAAEKDLDPEDWDGFRALCHRAIDEMVDAQRQVRQRPVWRPMPETARQAFTAPPPWQARPLDEVYGSFKDSIAAYALGNTHPAFWGWVHGSGTPFGMLAEMLSGAMNANLGGREHAPVHLERQVIDWCKEIFAFPQGTSGLLVSGTSMATLIALTVARHRATSDANGQTSIRSAGLKDQSLLTGYTSSEAHSSVAKAFELLGLGSAQLRKVPVDQAGAMDIEALDHLIEADAQDPGLKPFAVIATCGSVNIGAMDDLAAARRACDRHGLWLHVDGAFGAPAILAPSIRPRLAGIESADSLAFDFHKWLHVPYDAGCVLIRDGLLHRLAFGGRPDYLAAESRGVAAGEPWPCDYGIELSRTFRALKVWMTLESVGLKALGEMIEKNCAQARHLAARVEAEPLLELLAPTGLNIVCLRHAPPGMGAAALDRLNQEIMLELHEAGIAVPSSTRIDGAFALRVCIVNHRTRIEDLDRFLDAVLEIGGRLAGRL